MEYEYFFTLKVVEILAQEKSRLEGEIVQLEAELKLAKQQYQAADHLLSSESQKTTFVYLPVKEIKEMKELSPQEETSHIFNGWLKSYG